MKLIYENEFGTCVMAGGGNGGMRITELTGLSLPERNETCYTYAGVPGQTLGEVQLLARTITINMDILCEKTGMDIHRIAKIFSREGKLTVSHKQIHRTIGCRCISFTKRERSESFISAVVQLVADNPYFHDIAPVRSAIMQKQALLSSPFTLPCAVSSRKVEASVMVTGDAPAEPVITIMGTSDSTLETPEIVIENETTGAKITLSYGLSQGEELVIDIKNRTITSNKTENMYPYLSRDTFLNQFTLPCGLSVVSCKTIEPIYATLSYENNYAEAMY